MKRIMALLLALSMTLLAACTNKPAATTTPEPTNSTPAAQEPAKTEPIKVGLVAALTGPSAELGKGIEMAAKLYQKQINAKGGILGRELQIIIRDDASNTQTGLNAVNELIQKENVVAIIGPTGSGVVKATLGATAAAGVPHLINNGQDTEFGYDYPHAFQFAMPNRTQARMLAEFVTQTGKSKVGLLNANDGYGQPGIKDVIEELKAKGIEAVAHEEFKAADADMTSQLVRLQNAGVDVILFWGMGNDAATIRKNMATLGWDVPLVGPNPLVMKNFRDLAGAEARDTFSTYEATFIRADRTPEAEAYEKAWKAEYPEDTLFYGTGEKAHFYLAMGAQTYDALSVLTDAITRANSTDRAEILKALTATQNFKGVNSTISFSADKRVALPDEANILVEIKPDGVYEMK